MFFLYIFCNNTLDNNEFIYFMKIMQNLNVAVVLKCTFVPPKAGKQYFIKLLNFLFIKLVKGFLYGEISTQYSTQNPNKDHNDNKKKKITFSK